MIFFFIIIFPFLIPLVYLINLRLLFTFPDNWYWLLAILLAINLVYFILLWLKNKTKAKILISLYLYSVLFISAGMSLMIVMTNYLMINIFWILWPFLLLVLLYAILHFVYETLKTFFIDIKSIIAYVNIAVIFIVSAVLLNLNIFIAFPAWAAVLIFILVSLILNFPMLMLHESSLRKNLLYIVAITLIMAEIFIVMFYMPTGFYALGAFMAILYYLLLTFFLRALSGNLVRKDIIKHVSFASVLLIIILATSQWI